MNDISMISASALPHTQVDEYYLENTKEDIVKNLKRILDNPYPGIRPFKKSESGILFGRQTTTEALIEKLAERRFLAVLGSSGSGKSSLVRAGLVPVLESLPGINGKWKVAICRPGKNPFGNLAMAVFRSGIMPDLSPAEIYEGLSGSSFGFQELYESYSKPRQYNSLLIIDQFEELFRYRSENGTTGRNDSSLFVKMLLEISRTPALHTYVIITMRSEYLGDSVQIPQLVEEINKGQFLVPLLDATQLRSAVTEPALVCNAVIDPLLVDRIIGEAATYSDYLPILQHALRRTFQHAKARTPSDQKIVVTYEDYAAIGGMDNSIDQHARYLLAALDELQVKVCEILFKTITDKTTDGRGIRRPTSFSIIESICCEFLCPEYGTGPVSTALRQVIDHFRGESVNFLMPPPHVSIEQETEVDISHESLMRIWSDLVSWMQAEAANVILLRELVLRSKEQLLEGASLLTYEKWSPASRRAISWARRYNPGSEKEEDFIKKFVSGLTLVEHSIEHKKTLQRQAEAAQLALLEANQKKARKRLIWLFVASLALIMAVALAFTFANLNRKLKSADKEKNARIKELDSTRRRLDVSNDSLRKSSQNLSLAIGDLEAKKTELLNQNTVLIATRDNLKQVNQSLILQTRKAEEANKIATQAKHETDSLYGRVISSYKALEKANQKSQELENLALAVKHAEKSLAIPIYDVQRRNIKQQLALLSYKFLLHSGVAEQSTLQPQIYLGLYNALWGTTAGHQLDLKATPYPFREDRVGFAVVTRQNEAQGKVFLSAEHNGLWSWDIQDNKISQMRLKTELTLVSVQASPTGNWMAANGLDSLLLYQLKTEATISVPLNKHVRCYKFSPDGKWLFVVTRDSTLHGIDLSFPQDTSRMKHIKVPVPVEELAVSDHFLYGLTNGATIIKWPREETKILPGSMIYPPDMDRARTFRGTAVACSADDQLLVWGNEHGEVFYVQQNGTTGRNLTAFGGPVTAIAFNRSSAYLAIASFDKSLKIFALPSPQAQAPIHISNNEGPVTALFFTDGYSQYNKETLMAFISPGVLRSFPLDLYALACQVEQQATGTLSDQEIKLYFEQQVLSKFKEPVCR